MASQRYIIEGPVTDGVLISENMDLYYERAYISINFFTDDTFTTLAVPLAGTVVFEASEDGLNYGTIPNGTVTAADLLYSRPTFSGSVAKVRATTLGVTVATHYRATIARFYN